MNILKSKVSRRRFLQATGTAGAAGAVGLGASQLDGFSTLSKAHAQAGGGATVVNKSICGQCPARCGIDVYTTNGKVHAIYGSNDHPIANGKLCPKGHLGTYILYDPDRFKGPMKRTNPQKGRDEDPKFVPISWDEALNTVAGRLNALRDKGESHRFALFYGRGWGASCAGLQGTFGKLYGSPNVAIGHASICATGSQHAKGATDGNNSYNSYDYRNANPAGEARYQATRRRRAGDRERERLQERRLARAVPSGNDGPARELPIGALQVELYSALVGAEAADVLEPDLADVHGVLVARLPI